MSKKLLDFNYAMHQHLKKPQILEIAEPQKYLKKHSLFEAIMTVLKSFLTKLKRIFDIKKYLLRKKIVSNRWRQIMAISYTLYLLLLLYLPINPSLLKTYLSVFPFIFVFLTSIYLLQFSFTVVFDSRKLY